MTSYVVVGAILCITRFVGLDRSYWHDEIVTVRDFVREGFTEIVAGDLLNHQLVTMLQWATISTVGGEEIALRLWSVIPFIVGAILVTAWLHVRLGALSGVLFLFFATCSPSLLDVTRQARGYGLAFLVMGILIVAALEADRSGRSWTIVAFCFAGIAGTATLPNFGIAFLATGAVLVANPSLRRQTVIGVGISVLAIAAWYAPHASQLSESSREEYGVWISATGLPTAPIDQVLLPGLLRIDGEPPVESLLWLPIVALVLLPISASPLLRTRRTALIVGSGVVTTVAVLWATGTYVVPRYLSYLLVPLLMLLASGSASILARSRTRPPWFRVLVVLTILMVVVVAFVSSAAQVMRLPREAHKDAAATIRSHASASAPVFAYMLQPEDLAFYLERPVTRLRMPDAASRVCKVRQGAALVVQRWRLPPIDVPCITRPGTRHYRFEQYARGGEISVWFIPSGR